jgi:hypothetical protein
VSLRIQCEVVSTHSQLVALQESDSMLCCMSNRFWSKNILQGSSKQTERRLVVLHPERSTSDATMLTFDTAIAVQFKCSKFALSPLASICSHVGNEQYREGSIDCVVISFSSCPWAGSQHLILPAADFLEKGSDGNRYFKVDTWIKVPTQQMYKVVEGQPLSSAQPTQWFADLCAHMQQDVPKLTFNREAHFEERDLQFWSKYYVDLDQWIQQAVRLGVDRHLYCGVLWQHYCRGKEPNTAAAQKVAEWDRLLAAMQ